jgi:hypothetical protein
MSTSAHQSSGNNNPSGPPSGTPSLFGGSQASHTITNTNTIGTRPTKSGSQASLSTRKTTTTYKVTDTGGRVRVVDENTGNEMADVPPALMAVSALECKSFQSPF